MSEQIGLGPEADAQPKELSEVLIYWRQIANLEPKELAGLANVNLKLLEKMEAGKRKQPSRPVMTRIIRAFNDIFSTPESTVDFDDDAKAEILTAAGFDLFAGHVDPPEGFYIDHSSP